MRVLVTGSGGLLGSAITHEFAAVGEVVECGHRALDVSNESAVRATLDAVRPDAVINCAAYNDVDGAEDNPLEALEVNAFGVLTLARAAAAHDAALVHYSSDFVFDGETTAPYTEDDRPNPRGVYAASKLLGDWFALDRTKAWVLRVESLFGAAVPGARRVGSLNTIVRQIRQGEEVPVFLDRMVSPSYTTDVARATRAVLDRQPAPGLYHCVNSGAASWKSIAETAAALLGLPLRIKPITLESAALKAKRPKYCALSNARLASVGIVMPPWQEALERHIRSRS